MYVNTLKMTKEHFDYIREHIDNTIKKNVGVCEAYESGKFPRSEKVKDLNVRFANDVLRAAVGSSWISDNLYPYLNDTHIQTAIMRICPKLVRKY